MKRKGLIIAAGLLLCFMLSGSLRASVFTGTVAPGSPAGFLIPTNAGDNLTLTVTSTPSGTLTDLELFDPADNLVAVAEGNEPDGFSSIIDWTALTTGTQTLDVVDPGGAAFKFSVDIEGNTGGAPSAIANVPEPSSMPLCFLIVIGLLMTRAARVEAAT